MKEIKCVVWDLDNTLWDGILLEDPGVMLKEGVVDIIKALDARGILQSVSSKNDFHAASEKLREFGLLEYFLYPEIHWSIKSASVKEISRRLNIGLDTILFVDDLQYERDEVKFSLPEVVCMDAAEYKRLPALPSLNPRFITEDSARRRTSYLDDMTRKKEEENFAGPKDEFLRSLRMKLTITPAKEDDLRRVEELMIRTHQLNTTGLTYDHDDLKAMLGSDRYLLLTADLEDVYGSYGKIGLVLIEKRDSEWRLKLFILSCRVMNRGIGTIVLTEIMKAARRSSVKLTAEYLHTASNRMMYVTLKFANFIEAVPPSDAAGSIVLLVNDLTIIHPQPQFITITTENEWN